MTSAAEFLRDMSSAMANGVLEAEVSDIERLDQIADDLDALLGAAVPKQGSGELFEAVKRLRDGAA